MRKAPMKKCPKCQAIWHARKAKCACDYVFYVPTRKSQKKSSVDTSNNEGWVKKIVLF